MYTIYGYLYQNPWFWDRTVYNSNQMNYFCSEEVKWDSGINIQEKWFHHHYLLYVCFPKLYKDNNWEWFGVFLIPFWEPFKWYWKINKKSQFVLCQQVQNTHKMIWKNITKRFAVYRYAVRISGGDERENLNKQEHPVLH